MTITANGMAISAGFYAGLFLLIFDDQPAIKAVTLAAGISHAVSRVLAGEGA